MYEMHLPWLELAILIPLVGAGLTFYVDDPEVARKRSLWTCAFAMVCAFGAWQDFNSLESFQAHDHWNLVARWLGDEAVVIDELNAPLLPLSAMLYLLTSVATLRTKVRRFPFASMLLSEAILLALLTCRDPWGITLLLAAHSLLPAVELTRRGRSPRIFLWHMGTCVGLMALGCWLMRREGAVAEHSLISMLLITTAVLIRSGCAPVHCWMTDLFENATFGTSLLFVTPMVGAYAAARLVLPTAPPSVLRMMAIVALATSVYAAGMGLVQQDARRSFCYLFLSFSSLVLVGLGLATPIGVAGALCVWLSVGLASAGFGLTLRALESRTGRLSLRHYHGMYEHTPNLAVFFLITGLASVGFPGTVGFVGAELLTDGVVTTFAHVGVLVVLAAALNGIAVMNTYFKLFTGCRRTVSIPLQARWSERVAVLVLTALLVGGGLYPQPGIASRYHAAKAVLDRRTATAIEETESQTQEHPGEQAATEGEHSAVVASQTALRVPPQPATAAPLTPVLGMAKESWP